MHESFTEFRWFSRVLNCSINSWLSLQHAKQVLHCSTMLLTKILHLLAQQCQSLADQIISAWQIILSADDVGLHVTGASQQTTRSFIILEGISHNKVITNILLTVYLFCCWWQLSGLLVGHQMTTDKWLTRASPCCSPTSYLHGGTVANANTATDLNTMLNRLMCLRL